MIKTPILAFLMKSLDLAVQDVAHHALCVPNLNSHAISNSSWAQDCEILLAGHLEQLPGVILRDPLGNDGDAHDLLKL